MFYLPSANPRDRQRLVTRPAEFSKVVLHGTDERVACRAPIPTATTTEAVHQHLWRGHSTASSKKETKINGTTVWWRGQRVQQHDFPVWPLTRPWPVRLQCAHELAVSSPSLHTSDQYANHHALGMSGNISHQNAVEAKPSFHVAQINTVDARGLELSRAVMNCCL